MGLVDSLKKWWSQWRQVRELRQLAERAATSRRATLVRLCELQRIMVRLERVRAGLGAAMENCSAVDREEIKRLNRKNEIAFTDALNEYNKLRGEI